MKGCFDVPDAGLPVGGHLSLPLLHSPLEALDVGDDVDGLGGRGGLEGLLLELGARLGDLRVEAGHLAAEHGAELAEGVLVPRVVLERDLALHLAVVDGDGGAELAPRLARVEGGPGLG